MKEILVGVRQDVRRERRRKRIAIKRHTKSDRW